MRIGVWLKYKARQVMSSHIAMRTLAFAAFSLVLLTIFFGAKLTEQIGFKTYQMMNAITSIELKGTTAQLWLRDTFLVHHQSGTNHYPLQHINTALDNVQFLYRGIRHGSFLSHRLDSPANLALLAGIEKDLQHLRHLAQTKTSHDSASIEQQLNDNQQSLTAKVQQLQTAIQTSIQKDLVTISYFRVFVATLLILSALGVFLFLRFIAQENERHEKEIRELARFPEENPNPILFIGHQYTITYANQPAQKLLEKLNLSIGMPIPQPWHSFCHDTSDIHDEHEMPLSVDGSHYMFYFQGSHKQQQHVYIRDITELRKAQKEHDMLADIIERTTDIVSIAKPDGQFIYMNAAGRHLLGLKDDDDIQKHNMFEFHSQQEVERISQHIIPEALAKGMWSGEAVYIQGDGNECPASCVLLCNFEASGEPSYFSIVSRSLLEQKEMQAKLEHTQRLESLGVLAGGIAHDFNNILTIIMGNASLAKTKFEPEHPAIKHFRHIVDASQKAAQLCNEMLAYSGKGNFSIQAVNLSHIVREMTELLQVSIGKNVTLDYVLDDHLPDIEADIAQIQQIILNLITNANDAMINQQGHIQVKTYLTYADEAYLQNTYTNDNLTAGTYAVLEVGDNGCGMDKETLNRIFEPFFTTKFTGHGLGMSAVLGIIKSHHGSLKVSSKPGHGTNFQILFPIAPAHTAALTQAAITTQKHPMPSQTILVVDDDDIIRETSCEILESLGFKHCLQAADGLQGLTMFKQHLHDIQLVLLDMTMPKLNGADTLRELRKLNQTTHVILCSGYSEQDIAKQFEQDIHVSFIQKPYTPQDLEAHIQNIFVAV